MPIAGRCRDWPVNGWPLEAPLYMQTGTLYEYLTIFWFSFINFIYDAKRRKTTDCLFSGALFKHATVFLLVFFIGICCSYYIVTRVKKKRSWESTPPESRPIIIFFLFRQASKCLKNSILLGGEWEFAYWPAGYTSGACTTTGVYTCHPHFVF